MTPESAWRAQVEAEAEAAWVKANTWNLTYDDFIRLSYVKGSLEDGPERFNRPGGVENKPGDVVYVSPSGGAMTRAMVGHWIDHRGAFLHGWLRCAEAQRAKP